MRKNELLNNNLDGLIISTADYKDELAEIEQAEQDTARELLLECLKWHDNKNYQFNY